VIEAEFQGTVESAPTKLTYPHRIPKSNLDAVMQEFGAKEGEGETLKVGKEEIKCKVLAGSYKKGGATVEYKVYHSDTVPGGVDHKVITLKLLSVSPENVVVQTVVLEHEHLGTIESAPTKTTYHAKIKKSHLAAVLAEFGAKVKDTEESVMVAGKELKCKVLAGSTKKVCGLLVLAVLLSSGVAASRAADETDGMTENPKYKFWANFEPGATSTYTQATKLQGAEKATVPGGIERKTITYRLLNTNKGRAVVLTTVVEEDFLSTIESAPTRITYPAKVKKANLEAIMQEWSAKESEEESIKAGDKEISCKVRSGSHKVEGGTVEFKIYYSATVPGGVVKHTRVTKEGDKVVAETTTTLVSFGQGKGFRSKDTKKE
jgi:hypothetical protein